jgi:triosephosphate isomerase
LPTSSAPLGRPLLLLNLKAYPGCLGEDALTLGRALQARSVRARVAAALAPAGPDLGRLSRSLKIPVLAQHTDPFEPGARTGFTVAEAVAAAGARGSLVNHSEHPLSYQDAATVVRRLRESRLTPVVCAPTVAAARRLARLKPPYLAIEPPELIGGDRSVSTARPQVISGSVSAVHRVSPSTHVLCGAGIHDRHDVRLALELGAEGILVASAVTKSRHTGRAMAELLRGYPSR